MKPVALQSALAQLIEGFIAHKRAIGYRYATGTAILKRFDGFCIRYHGNEQMLSKEIVTHWAQRRPGESIGTLGIRIGPVRQFAIYLHKLGREAYVIPCRILPTYHQYIPYIFTNTELAAFFSQTDACRYWARNPIRHMVMPVLFRMLYCCGLRVSEASSLKVNRVDLQNGVLTIYGGKFGKDRRVPMSEELTNRCRDYYDRVHSFLDYDNYFLGSSSCGCPLNVKTVYSSFRKFLWDARISHGGKGKGPRIHDLRHTFAVHCLRRWVEEGRDLSAYLPILKTYLGHTHFRETAYYLRLTADLYPTITAQVEQVFGQMIPHIGAPHEND
jgi:integrase/recombinase XerD